MGNLARIWHDLGISDCRLASSQCGQGVSSISETCQAIGSLNTEQEKLALEAESKWFSVFEGELSDKAIYELVTDLKQRKLEASHKHFKDQTLPHKPNCETEATERTRAYFESYFGTSPSGDESSGSRKEFHDQEQTAL